MVGALAVVTNNLEPSNHLADGKETDSLSSNDTGGSVLLAVPAAHLAEHLGWAVHEGAWVLEGVQERLCVVLEGLDRSDTCQLTFCRDVKIVLNLRWAHLPAIGNQLAELKGNSGVVDGWWHKS